MNTEDYRQQMWEYLETNYPDVKVANKGHGRSPWRYATPKDKGSIRPDDFNHRQVLPEELILDYDCADVELQKYITDTVGTIREPNLNFSIWRTNGKENGGAHLQAMFDIPKEVGDLKLLKSLLLQHLVGEQKDSPIDMQILGNHLIRFEGGLYDKVVPWKAGRKTLVYCQGDPFKKNKVPKAVWDAYADKILSYKLASLRRGKRIPSFHKTPKSINFILSERFKEFKDGSKRALFVLASYFYKLPDKELYQLLRDFARYNCKEPVADYTIKRMMQKQKEHKGRRVGEQYRKELLKDMGAYEEVYGDG